MRKSAPLSRTRSEDQTRKCGTVNGVRPCAQAGQLHLAPDPMWTVVADVASSRALARATFVVPLAGVARRAETAEVRLVVRTAFDERGAVVDRRRADALAVRARDVVARAAARTVVAALRVARAPRVAREDARADLAPPRTAVRPRVIGHRSAPRSSPRPCHELERARRWGGGEDRGEVASRYAWPDGPRGSSRLRGRAAPSRHSLAQLREPESNRRPRTYGARVLPLHHPASGIVRVDRPGWGPLEGSGC